MDILRTAPAIASAEAVVGAPLRLVWAVQTDLASWPGWNPDVGAMDLRGPLAPGTVFRWTGGGVPITSTIEEVVPEQRIVWIGRAPLGIRAVHVWTFAPEGAGTRVRTEESFDGVVVRLFAGPMRRMLATALAKGLAALTAEAERRASVAMP